MGTLRSPIGWLAFELLESVSLETDVDAILGDLLAILHAVPIVFR